MTPTPLTFNSIIPVGTRLKCVDGSSLSKYEVWIVTAQDTTDTTKWLDVVGEASRMTYKGYNPHIFELVEDVRPEELWTL